MKNYFHMGITKSGEAVIIIYGYITPNTLLKETKVDYEHCYVYPRGTLPEFQDLSIETAVKSAECQKMRHAGDYLNKVSFDPKTKVSMLKFIAQSGKLTKLPVSEVNIDLNLTNLTEPVTLKMVIDNWKKMDDIKDDASKQVEESVVIPVEEEPEQAPEETTDSIVDGMVADLKSANDELIAVKNKIKSLKKDIEELAPGKLKELDIK